MDEHELVRDEKQKLRKQSICSPYFGHGPLRWTAHELITANYVFNSFRKIKSFF